MRRLLFFVLLSIAAPAFAGPTDPQAAGQTSDETVASMKSHSGNADYASAGAGSRRHIACELLRLRSFSYVVHIPCRAGESAAAAALARDVPLLVVSILAILPDGPTLPQAAEAVAKQPWIDGE